jgi:hypothetical protein
MGILDTFKENPRTFIIGTIISWLVSTFVLTPTRVISNLLEDAGVMLGNTIESSLRSAYGAAGEGVYNSLNTLITVPLESIQTVVESLGLGAPIASTIAILVTTAVFAGLVVGLVSIVVPQVGGAVLSRVGGGS